MPPDVVQDSSNWIQITQFVIAIIGAAAWFSPMVFDWLKKSKIDGRLLSLSYSKETRFTNGHTNETITGIGYFLKFALVALNKSFSFKEVEVFLKYPSEPNNRKGRILTPRNYTIEPMQGKVWKLREPVVNRELLQFSTVLEADKINFRYLYYIADKSKYEDFEKLTLVFTGFNGEKKHFSVNWSDIDSSNILFEDHIWDKTL